jgi:hypothetical protein
VLVDLQDVVIHVMLPRVREFYSLERMWESDTGPAIKAVPAVGGVPSGAPAAAAAKKKAARPAAKSARPRRKSAE